MLLGIAADYCALPGPDFAQPCRVQEGNVVPHIGITFEEERDAIHDAFVQDHLLFLQGAGYIEAANKFLCQDVAPQTPKVDCAAGSSPPPFPNAWSDGSWLHGATGHFSIGSFGCWHPDRRTDEVDSEEADFAREVELPSWMARGLPLAGPLLGRFGSSTRAEIAGGIAVLTRPGPVHVGTDSTAFLTKAEAILRSPDIQPRRPFALQADGDLWETFTRVVMQKGPDSICLSWHKAHASFRQFMLGQVSPHASLMNAMADWCAAQGLKVAGLEGLCKFLKYHACKQQRFIELLVDINLLILRVLDNDEQRRLCPDSLPTIHQLIATSNAQSNADELANEYNCPDFYSGFELGIVEPNEVGLDDVQISILDQLYLFWRNARFLQASEGQQGTSWIEIYARYQFLGGVSCAAELQPEHARAHISFKHKLKLFVQASRNLFRQQGSPSIIEYTKPCRVSQFRLSAYGINGFVPCLRIILCLMPDAARSMHAMLGTQACRQKSKALCYPF